MGQAQTKGVTEASASSDWAMDFMTALSSIASQWTSSYRINKQNAIADGSLQYRKLANNFRRRLAIHHPNKPKIGKGAFSTYAGKPNEAPENEKAENPKIGNK
jgi:hypothetical protein